MSRLRIFDEAHPDEPLLSTDDHAAMAAELQKIGVTFEQWQATQPITPGASSDEVMTAYRADIDAAADPKTKLVEIEERLNRLRSPFRTAETFWVEEIIDPRDTRKLLCEFVHLAEPLLTPGRASFTMRP